MHINKMSLPVHCISHAVVVEALLRRLPWEAAAVGTMVPTSNERQARARPEIIPVRNYLRAALADEFPVLDRVEAHSAQG